MTKDTFLFDTRSKLPFCGCGDPAAAIMLIRRVLELHDTDTFPKNADRLIPDDGMRMMILGSITEADLLEHGGTIDGSWLTDDGRRFLAAMRDGFAADDEDAAEAWLDDISGLEMP